MGILQIVIILLLIFVLSIPVGKYIYKIISGERCFVDPVMNRVDNLIYKISGIKKEQEMNWKQYAVALVLTNLVLTVILFAILRLQNLLGLNPNGIGPMEQSLSFNTAISFITNTNFQSYSGESGASYFVQMILTCFMFVAPATGLAAAAAFLRGIIGKSKSLGNFFVDLTRFITRLLLPVSIVLALVLVFQGVPQTLSHNQTVATIEGKMQDIPLGPVASLEAVKNLASNGGGFYGANSAHPFENPTPLTNIITIISLGLIATATVVAFGHMLKNKKQAWVLFGVAAFLLVLSVGVTYYSESKGNPVLERVGLNQSMGNMEGKELRFSVAESSLFTGATTAYQVGAVNSMHDSLTPAGGMMAMWNMMLQTAFGGKGTGFIYLLMFAILTVFLCGLMVGRTPEFLGKKIEGREIKMVAIAILLHPLLILIPTAISLITPGAAASTSNPGFHGLSQILYNFTSASANNGSAFAGMMTNTVYYNVLIGIIMLVARYLPIIAMLAVAGSMASKKPVPESIGTFRTDNTIFAVTLLGVIIIVGALTFFPALALGPIAEQLTLR
ncbi:MAG: potassium-transporting ATPase subunit KdpA [Bacillota bacterium]|nr:potassium-transporting ATPase subunit KdpA [Bacillota bacterium]